MNSRRTLPRQAVLLAAMCVVTTAAFGCATVAERVGDARGTVSAATERARFCLSVVQAVASLEGETSPEAAVQALEDVVDRAPDDIGELLASLESQLQAADGDWEKLDGTDIADTLREVQQRTTQVCDPRT